jgi:hypothetical protein
VLDTRRERVLLPSTLVRGHSALAGVVLVFCLGSARAAAPLKGRVVFLGDSLEHLRCTAPDLAEKEFFIYLLAHNLIRCLMTEAVARHQGDLERVSFKGAVDGLRQYSAAIASARNRKMRDALWGDLLVPLVRDALPLRPNRIEPRTLR